MEALEIIAGILVGAIAFAFVLYLAVRILRSGRNAAEANKRIYREYYKMDKKQ